MTHIPCSSDIHIERSRAELEYQTLPVSFGFAIRYCSHRPLTAGALSAPFTLAAGHQAECDCPGASYSLPVIDRRRGRSGLSFIPPPQFSPLDSIFPCISPTPSPSFFDPLKLFPVLLQFLLAGLANKPNEKLAASKFLCQF